MESKIKTNFTEEEISEYIKELNSAIGNKRKVNKVLDLYHLPILVAYLRKIGVSEELLSLAAVAEFTRYKMREVLTDPNMNKCEVLDTGVEFERKARFPHLEKIGVDEGNVFRLGNEKYFGRKCREIDGEEWPVDAYIYLKRKMYFHRDPDRPINRCGFAFNRFYFSHDFEVQDKIEEGENGIQYFLTEKYVEDFGYYTEKRIYAGEAVNIDGIEYENTLRENYDIYTALFPKYKEWLDAGYISEKSTLENSIRVTDSEIYRERIKKYNNINPLVKAKVEKEISKYQVNKDKLDSLVEFLDGYICKTEEGVAVIEEILNTALTAKTIDLDEHRLEDSSEKDLDVSKLEYEELKRRAEMLVKENDDLEELLESLRDVNEFNERLIKLIEEKIRNIVKSEKVNEEARDEIIK